MKKLFHFLGALLIFFPLSLQGQNFCEGRLSGILRAAEDQSPIAYARITIKELNLGVVTDSLGRYEISNLCPGTYTFICEHPGCALHEEHLHIQGKETQELIIFNQVLELDAVHIRAIQSTPPPLLVSQHLKGQELQARMDQSLGQILTQLPGVSALQTGPNIAKPMIQGLYGQHVLMLYHGIRQAGQQWGSDHAPALDPRIADRITVIKGAGAVRYGAGAFGGVVLIEPRALPDSAGLGGALQTGLNSNGQQGLLSGHLAGKGQGPWAWRIQGTWRRGGNRKSPDYFLDNTGLAEQNASIHLGRTGQMSGMEFYYNHFFTRLGIFSGAHLGSQAELQQQLEADQPFGADQVSFRYQIDRPSQTVRHQMLSWKGYVHVPRGDKLALQYALQLNHRQEFDRFRPRGTNASGDLLPEVDFRLQTHSLEGSWEYGQVLGYRGSLGIAGLYQSNLLEGRPFIPNYVMMGGEAFGIQKWQGKHWGFEAGARYDYRWVHSAREEQGQSLFTIRQYQGASGTLAASYDWKNGTQALVQIGSAWRPPHVSELFSQGLHHGSASVELGDSSLLGELGFKGVLQISHQGPRFSGEITAYAQHFSRYIFLNPIGLQRTIRGTFPAFQYSQAQASLTGLDFWGSYQLVSGLNATIKGSWIKAVNMATRSPLPLIPPQRGEIQLSWDLPALPNWRNSYIKVGLQGVARAPQSVQSQDLLPPPPGYLLVQAGIGTRWQGLGLPLQVDLRIDNLLNTRYRDYLNRYRYFSDEIGRNMVLNLAYQF